MSIEQQQINKNKKKDGFTVFTKVKKSKGGRFALNILIFFTILSVFGDFIANDKPIYSVRNNQTEFPVFKSYLVDLGMAEFDAEVFRNGWKALKYEKVIWPIVPYSATALDLKNDQFVSPFGPQNVSSKKDWHWLGTDQLGRDVLAGIISGARSALLVGLIAMGIAAFIGIFFGAIAGYFGDQKFKMTRLNTFISVVGVILGMYWAIHFPSIFEAFSERLFLSLMTSIFIFGFTSFLFYKLGRVVDRITGHDKKVNLPIDLIIMRFIEVINSIPGLLLILAIVALVSESSIYTVMVVIGCIAWTGIARFIRGELIKIRNLPYIESVEAMGFSEFRILLKHAIPNAMGPVVIAIAFGMAGAILAEASLSFIGIGGAVDQVTWGSLINESRKNISAWWIAIIPGFMIFLIITSFNLLGEVFTDLLGSK